MMKYGMVKKAERSRDVIHIRSGEGSKRKTVCELSHDKVEPVEMTPDSDICVICFHRKDEWPQEALEKYERIK